MVRSSLAAVALLAAFPCFAQFPSENDRLMATARLWVTVEYFHPYLAYRDIDWDQALITAIPKVRAATNAAEFRGALSAMLDELHDPETYILPSTQSAAPQDVKMLSLTPKSVDASPQVTVAHTATDIVFITKPGRHFPSGLPGNDLFELHENHIVPAIIAALAQSGGATIRSDATHYQIESTESVMVELSGMYATVRLSEPLKRVPIVQTGTASTVPEPAIPSAPIVRQPDARYTDPYPPVEARLLAAIKTWGAIHYFFAYKDLMDEEWDDVFATSLPKFIQAHDATDYNLTLADLLTHLADSNTAPHSKTLDAYFGEMPVGLRIRLLDKYPIITDVLDPVATQVGVHPGDVVKRIGTESITDRFRRFVQYIPASTPQRSGYDTIQTITNGPVGTELALTIENARGESHVIRLARAGLPSAPQRNTEAMRVLPGNIGYLDLDRLTPDAAERAMERLKDTTGIIFDLRGKAPAARSIAAHLTSDANGAAALVTTPIALHPDITTSGIATQTASTFVVQTLPTPRPPLYKGKTVALIDERTIGESEYAGLLFEAANKTQFIGVPSAGADSVIAELPLPGDIVVSYSSQDIRHGNGGKLQRLGIQPNISAPMTAKGLRDGKDEPLNAALTLLSPLGKQQLAFYTQTKP